MRNVTTFLLALIAWAVVALVQHPESIRAQITNGPNPNAILCNGVQSGTPTVSTTTLVITGHPNTNTYICGIDVTSTAASTFQIGYSFNGGCTSPTTLSPVFVTAIGIPFIDHVPYATGMIAPAGAHTCITSGSGQLQVLFYYAQF